MKKPKTFETPYESYRVTAEIGTGGNGTVYECVGGDESVVAIKCLRPEHLHVERLRRFRNEIHFCQNSDHRHVLRVIDTGMIDVGGKKCPFYVMPKFSGTLRSALQEIRPPEERLQLFEQIRLGVEFAHLKKTWHRDLKPENILWHRAERRLVVADFGSAHFAEAELATLVETRETDRLANFTYASPEQRVPSMRAQVDHRSDIYSLGLILHEMFTGHLPLGNGYRRIAESLPEMAWVDILVDKMLQNDPASRIASLDSVAQEMIARRRDYVDRQKLDALRATVVPAAAVSEDEVKPLTIVNVDWRDDTLILFLDRSPNHRWTSILRQPHKGLSFYYGSEPESCNVSGDRLTVRATRDIVQHVVNQYKAFVSSTNQQYAQEVRREAIQREANLRSEMRRRVEEEEQRQQVLKQLKL
jgi:serine/threonine protein kinase